MPRQPDRLVFLPLLVGILVTYALVIGLGGTRIGDPLRIAVLGVLVWLALRVRGLGRYRWWTLGVTAVLVIGSVLASRFGSARISLAVVGFATFVMISVLILAIASEVLRIGEIDTTAVLGVLCVYLLLALFFSSVDQMFAAASHDYLHGAGNPPTVPDLLYFSVITMTTVGYGDITPASQLARAVAVLEALTGQLYLVSVVAAVVGGWQGRRPRA
jgi:hypothetical protein